MSCHIVTSDRAARIIKAEIKRRNKDKSNLYRERQETLTDEIIMAWEENRKQSS